MSSESTQLNNNSQYMQEVDEFSLADIWLLLLRRKALVAFICVVSLFVAFLYVFLVKPVYRAEIYLLPPTEKDIIDLRISHLNSSKTTSGLDTGKATSGLDAGKATSGLDTGKITVDYAFKQFIAKLKSRLLQRRFFDEGNVLETLSGRESNSLTSEDVNGVFESRFYNKIKVEKNSKNSKESVIVTLEAPNPELAKNWLNELVRKANAAGITQLVDSVETVVEFRKQELSEEIAAKRNIAKNQREDQIERLEEQYKIAKNLNIKDNIFLPDVKSAMKQDIFINTADTPAYLRGARSLKAEVRALETRKSDDPYIMGLRNLQESKKWLESINIDIKKLKVVTIEQPAYASPYPVTPNVKMIVLLSLVIGGMLGIFVAIMIEIVQKLNIKLKDMQQ